MAPLLVRLMLLVALALGSAAPVQAFSNVYFFGDSLSDTGNIRVATGGAQPPAPYYLGRFSDGPVWVEHLAAGLGHAQADTASLLGGNNHAWGGARTAGGSIPSLLAQVTGFTGALPALDPYALYVVVAGGNDMRDARSANPAHIGAAAAAAAANLKSALGLLAAKGAQHVLVSNLPDLGRTPEAVALGLVGVSTQATDAFNALLPSVLSHGQGLGLSMSFLDMAGLAAAVFDDATNQGGATYGILNVFTPCGSFTGSIGISCAVSGFSDALHPSARMHQLIGMAALAAVPEPHGLLLIGAGLLVLLRRRAA